MSILSDSEIANRCIDPNPMISPFSEDQVRGDLDNLIISYGCSSYGYDIRIGDEFKIFHNALSSIVDPKNFVGDSFISVKGDEIIIPPNSFVLGVSYERIIVPRDILVLCIGKSTYARCGLIVNVTPLEPEWRGHITIEISNTTPLPAKIYSFEGIAQLLFLKANNLCRKSYADKKGKYQDQCGVTLPRM